MSIPFLDLPGQYERLRPEMEPAVLNVLSAAALIGGEPLHEFEAAFSNYLGVKHCIGVGNGTDALEIILASLGLPPGGEVIVPANSFIGSAEAVSNSGLRVRFCDVDDSYSLDPEIVELAISDSTVAIMAVHLYGQPANLSALSNLAEQRGLALVEDCAQAHGATYEGRRVGGLGNAGGFSFYPGKNLGAYGDGGAVVTNDDEVARSARMRANHGRLTKYDHEFEGRNSRLDALQARVLSVKLAHLDEWTARRREVAVAYRDGLAGIEDLRLQRECSDGLSAHHLFPIRTQHRDALKDFLQVRGVQTGIHYPIALPDLAAYEYLGQKAPNASRWAGQLLSLPIGEHLSETDVSVVISAVQDFFAQARGTERAT